MGRECGQGSRVGEAQTQQATSCAQHQEGGRAKPGGGRWEGRELGRGTESGLVLVAPVPDWSPLGWGWFCVLEGPGDVGREGTSWQ